MMIQITLGGQKISLKLSISFKILSREAVELNSCLSLVRSSFVIVSFGSPYTQGKIRKPLYIGKNKLSSLFSVTQGITSHIQPVQQDGSHQSQGVLQDVLSKELKELHLTSEYLCDTEEIHMKSLVQLTLLSKNFGYVEC